MKSVAVLGSVALMLGSVVYASVDCTHVNFKLTKKSMLMAFHQIKYTRCDNTEQTHTLHLKNSTARLHIKTGTKVYSEPKNIYAAGGSHLIAKAVLSKHENKTVNCNAWKPACDKLV